MASVAPLEDTVGLGPAQHAASERSLVAGLRAGRQDAFELLYELYSERIFNLSLRIVQNREDARDITQDVFLKAFRKLPTGDHLSVKPWLYRVAVNACYDHLRTRRLHRTIDDAHHDTRALQMDTFEQADLSRRLEQTLARLSERHRTVLVLKDVHGLRHDEIASILGVSRNATETLLFRARATFRREYAALSMEQPQGSCSVAREASVAAIGLGLLLHSAPLPASLQAPLAFGSGAATAAAGGAAAAAGGGAAGVGASASVAASGGSAGLTAFAGGGLAKIGGALTAKVLIAVVATSCAVTAAGVTAHRIDAARHQHAAAATATRLSETKSEVAGPGAGEPNGGQSGTRGNSASARAHRNRPGTQGNSIAAHANKGRSAPHGNGADAHATKRQSGTHGNSAAAHASKPAKPLKPAKPAPAPKPGKPAKPTPAPKPSPAPKPGKPGAPGPKG